MLTWPVPLLVPQSAHCVRLRTETTTCSGRKSSATAWLFSSDLENPDVLRTCCGFQGLCSFSGFSPGHCHWCEALQSSIYLQMRVEMADSERGCFAFLMPLTGHQSTGTPLKPCFNLSARANRPPAGLPGCAACVTLCDSRKCVFHIYIWPAGLAQPTATVTLPRFLGCCDEVQWCFVTEKPTRV